MLLSLVEATEPRYIVQSTEILQWSRSFQQDGPVLLLKAAGQRRTETVAPCSADLGQYWTDLTQSLT